MPKTLLYATAITERDSTGNLCGTYGQVPWQQWPYINTVQKLFEIEHFRFTIITTSIENQSIEIRHELRSFS
jgi:hypothetical protein